MQQKSSGDTAYERKMVWLLAVLFGIVGLDRLVIVYLFPILIPELGLSNTQAGAIASVLALTWAVSTWVLGGVSDRHGRKKVLIYSGIFFSVMTWMTGAVKSFTGMLVVRGLLGVGEGGVFSASVATLAEISTPKRRGLNMGIHQAFFPLLGIGLGPIIATQLSLYMPWEWVFFLLGIPGIILTYMLAKLMREPKKTAVERSAVKPASVSSVLKYRNIWVTTLIGSLFQTGLFVFSTFVALYLTQVVGLSLSTTGLIVSGWGFGGFIGMIAVPALSDRLGRKPVLIGCATLYGALMLLFAMSHAGPWVMFGILFAAGIFGFGIAPLFLAVIPSESVPSNMTGAAVGVPTGVSELIGGVLMPVIAGGLADFYGLAMPMLVVGAVSLAAAVVGLFLIETAPEVARLTQPVSTHTATFE
ncbi:MFS transporter [Pseudomonas sp. FP2335]|uniref:MFS transporter n=1 Tax=Pseudomonas sp. FP2335 TaxID=2954092 RepID=UPI0027352C9A|nr:MFS transporter [Pseudomonas sp. FP2335]WLH81757.1 MFS transporter [Pseudomonas sp. FP2335]